MKNGQALCLNMIVKNEMANLERCLAAIAPHIDCWVIGDTGSSDGTQDFVMSFFAAHCLPGEIHSFPFENFEQARNTALDCAYASPLAYDYLLFCDADMELVVDDADFRERLAAPGYRLIQRTAGGLTYWNARLARRGAAARYHGVTHEYLDVPGGAEQLHGVWYRDHASGANRTDKFERDIKLLTTALGQDPSNYRYWFYLAQSYKDCGRTAEAAETYGKRVGMGGWEEEAWYAQMMLARCLRDLGDEGGFLREALAAFNRRPARVEPLYDLAKYYRERGMYEASVLYSEPGVALARPEDDVLFLEDFVYTAGLKEEYSIAANYSKDPGRKDRGFAACNWLALNRDIPARARDLARWNLFFYLEPAGALMPSFKTRPIEFAPPSGYHLSNPSVVMHEDQILISQRTINYVTTGTGKYETPGGEPVHTRTFLIGLTHELEVRSTAEILPPEDPLASAFQQVLRFDDLRLFVWRGELWCLSSVRQLTSEGRCDQVLARIDTRVPKAVRFTDWRVLHPSGACLHEKNWIPQIAGENLRFVCRWDPTHVLDDEANTLVAVIPKIAAEQFSGGSPAIAFDDGWLSLVHEVSERDGRRYYQHRFVWLDAANELRCASRPFFFDRKGIELAAGLAWHPDGKRLLISYGIDDSEAWLSAVDAVEVRQLLQHVERLPTGTPGKAARDVAVLGDAAMDCREMEEASNLAGLAAPERPVEDEVPPALADSRDAWTAERGHSDA